MSDWNIIQLSPKEWAQGFSENIHKVVFKEIKSAALEKIDYALLCVKGDTAIGYVTVKEYDKDTVYWQWGGVLPQFRKSITAVKAIEMALEWQKKRSLRITTYVQNINLPMLRFYLAYGFLIIGTRVYNNKTMVDLVKELHGNQ